jgi:hypothetical protein
MEGIAWSLPADTLEDRVDNGIANHRLHIRMMFYPQSHPTPQYHA